ncbi:hypothetical protein SNE40_022869 [Patella caerulea]|uniref:MRH domain-containing protein n=1 Tax=Patella caerulea TaxID=87958 RepID=A0AAN8G919_PATCE
MKVLGLFCVCLSVVFAQQPLKPCKTDSTCSCTNVDGYIDLHPIANRNNTPYFRNVTNSPNYIYSYNPCYAFTEGSVCQNAAICQLDTSVNQYYVIGYADTVRSIADSEYGLIFQYTATTDMPLPSTVRTANVILTCDENREGELQFVKEDPIKTYYFNLYSKHACPIPPPPTVPGPKTTPVWTAPPGRPTGPPAPPSPTSVPVIFSLKAVVVLLLCILFVLTFLCGLIILAVCVFSAKFNSTNNDKAELGQSANYSHKDEMKRHLKNEF